MKEHITTTEKENKLAQLTHLSSLSGFLFPFASIIAPLVVWLSNKESKFVDQHGKAVVNFQLSLYMYYLIGVVLFIIYFLFNIMNGQIQEINLDNIQVYSDIPDYFFSSLLVLSILAIFYLALQVINIVTTIVGSQKAVRGEFYKYPISIRFIR